MNRIRSFLVIAFLGACFTSFAQNDVKNKFNPINTGVTSLGIAPEADLWETWELLPILT